MLCNKFITFMDDRGVDLEGPQCHCDLPCRLQVAGRYAVATPRVLHHVCAFGQCGYYGTMKNGDGDQETLPEEFIELFAMIRII